MRVSCPNCQESLEVSEDSDLGGLVCTSCGSSFSLIKDLTDPTEQTVDYAVKELRKLGRFELVEQVGTGAFGSVWKARDTELDRQVAVKVPRQGEISAAEAEKFLREARAAAQLKHPHIVSVHEVGRSGGIVYIVSDFVEGVTLSAWLTGKELTPRQAVELIAKIADALHHAHEAGVIHRDLKPGNIMLDLAGEPHLMDFGLARRQTEATVTVAGHIMGTPAYMSPEQARGEGHAADRRTDIYSLGVVLFRLLTGELPFRGAPQMLILQILREEPPSPRKLNQVVPRDLETICLKCLEKNPERRYQTARELADELGRFLKGEPIRARPVGRPARMWRWCRRNPVVAGLTAAVAAALFLGATVASFFALRAQANALQAEREKKAAEEARADETKARRAAELMLADTFTSFGLQASELGKPTEALAWFAGAARRSAGDDEREQAGRTRFWTWARHQPWPVHAFNHRGTTKLLGFHPSERFLLVRSAGEGCLIWNLETGQRTPLPNGDKPTSAAAWSPDGQRLALVDNEGQAGIYRFADGDRLAQLPPTTKEAAISILAFSSDGRRLALAGKYARVWDVATSRFVTPELPHPGEIHELALNRQGDMLATACADHNCRLYAVRKDTAGGQADAAVPVFPAFPHGAQHFLTPKPVFIADDKILVTLEFKKGVVMHDTATGKLAGSLPMPGTMWVALSPDRNLLAVANGGVGLFSASTGEPLGERVRHANFAYKAVFSPDGQTLLSVSADRTAKLWNLQPGPSLAATIPHQDEVLDGAYSSSGRWFATAQVDGLVRVWSFEQGIKKLPISRPDSFVQISPDGRRALPSGWNVLLRPAAPTRVYELATGQPAGPALDPGGSVYGGAISPDGRHVLLLTSVPGASEGQFNGDDLLEAGRVHIFELSTGKRRFDPLETPSQPLATAYHPRGDLALTVCAKGQILVIDVTTNRIVKRLDHGGQLVPGFMHRGYIRFAPDGSRFVTWGLGGKTCVWDAQTWQRTQVLDHHFHFCNEVDFSADGKLLATASSDRTACVWDLATGARVAAPLKHPDWVFTARFSPDGGRLLTACRDRMARLWDWRTGKLACPAMAHNDEVFGASFSRDGRWLFSAGRDSTVRIWEQSTGKPMGPALRLPGWCYDVTVSPDGQRVIIPGVMPWLTLLSLDDLVHAKGQPLSLDALQLLGEILSGQSFHEGGGVVNLSTEEWLQRWQRFRAEHPALRPFVRSTLLRGPE